jgi:hypothetical protein
MSRVYWYLSRTTTITRNGVVYNVPGVCRKVPYNKRGINIGRAVVPALDIEISAVRFDEEILSTATIDSYVSDLESVNDSLVFDLRAGLEDPADTWARKGSWASMMGNHGIDTDRKPITGKKVKNALMVAGQSIMLYSKLGPYLPLRALDERFDSIPLVSREAFAQHLTNNGILNQHLPTDSNTWRQIYRTIMVQGDPLKWNQNPHRWIFGHKDSTIPV